MLFAPELNGWGSWGEVFCDTALFAPLVRAIMETEGMPQVPPTPLTPGTNAVFRCGDVVLKIFAPKETGIDSTHDFAVEVAMLAHAMRVGVPTPKALAHGAINDRYRFQYLVMDFVEGREAGEILPRLSPEKRRALVAQLLSILGRLHQPAAGLPPQESLVARALENFRLDRLPKSLASAMRARARALTWPRAVSLHGDLTGENILVRPDGSLVLIDFADSVLGPAYYEWVSIVFELLRCDRDMVRAFSFGMDIEAFTDALLDGLSLHDFGPDILLAFVTRQGISLADVPDLVVLKSFLMALWE